MSLQALYAEALIPSAMVFGEMRVRLGLESRALVMGLVLLEKEKETQDLFPPLPCEDITRRPSTNQREGPRQTRDLLAS